MEFQHTSGKVRDIYDISRGKLVIVTTDRISAFDIILPKPVTGKGKLLNAISLFWFDLTKDIIPNHVISSDLNDMPEYFQKPEFEGRTLLVKKLRMLPFECIVRGYMFGHMWEKYSKSGKYELAQKLDVPVFTPSTKAKHDEYISFKDMEQKIGAELANKVKDTSLSIYNRCYDYAYRKGVIIADAKFEFGLDENDNLVLADEILTPDSSRFWSLAEYKVGVSPKSYDKQFIRDWLVSNKTENKLPDIPDDILDKTAEIYATLLAKITS